MITSRAVSRFDKPATVLLISQEQVKENNFNFQNKALVEKINTVHKIGQLNTENGDMFPLLEKGRIILLVSVGKSKDLSLTSLRTTIRKAMLSSFLKKVNEMEVVPFADKENIVRATVEAVSIGTYKWKKYLTTNHQEDFEAKRVFMVTKHHKLFDETVQICQGVRLARDLINDNADTVTSDFIEKTIRGIVKSKKNVSLEVLNRKELQAKGLNLHLAVNKASPKEPKLIIVKYTGTGKNQRYTAIVGKGLTFDTGGLNLKPTGHLETMRVDMSGAAAVVGILKNVLNLQLERNIIFAVGLAENAIGSQAYKPGDVFKSYDGKTVEIGNTDAEGRLVLADAMAYVVKNYKPEKMIDLATLTGACVVALGYDYTGLMSNDDDLAQKLLACAQETDDRAWRLPLYPELKEHIKGQIADIKNTGLKGAAGTISAAEFLRQFVENTKWAHLDIAGTAFVDTANRWYYGYGATGVGVRLLTDFLMKDE